MDNYAAFYTKIQFLNNMATQIASFGEQCGAAGLMDYVDINCGAIPEGDYTEVVDQTAQLQFLKMYLQVAENRFAFAVTALIKMKPEFIKSLEEFCTRTGREMQLPPVPDMQTAYIGINRYWPDGMPGEKTKTLISLDEKGLVWEKLTDCHEASWARAGGQLDVYYRLFKCFVDGLLEASGIKLKIVDNFHFSLMRGPEYGKYPD